VSLLDLPRLQRLREERGFALVLALGILIVLSVMAAVLIDYTSSNQRSSYRGRSDQLAYSLAEDGVNQAAAVLTNNAHPDVWSGHPTQGSPQTITYDGGSVAWWAASVTCSPNTCWRLTALSTVRNPTGPRAAPVHRTVSMQMRVTKSHTTGFTYGNFVYADGDVKIDGSADIEEPVVAGGNLDMSISTSGNVIMSIGRIVTVSGQILTNNGLIGNGPTTTLTAGINATASSIPVANASGFAATGTLKIDNEWIKYSSRTSTSFTVATTCGSGSTLCRGYGGFGASPAASHSSGALVDGRLVEVHARQGCTPVACATNPKIFSATPPDGTPIPVTKPAFDETVAFASAAPGPKSVNTCTGTSPTGSFATFFDNQPTASATLNHSISSAINLTGSTYDCTATAPDGTTGEIKWDGITLTVHGTVFFDGDVTIGSNGRYSTGSAGATIWTSGDIGPISRAMCGSGTPPACNSDTWDPNSNVLGLVAHTFAGSTNTHCATFSAGANFQGLVYADGGCTWGFDEKAGAAVQGLVIASSVHLSGSAGNPSPALTGLPNGFPGNDVYDVSLVQGSYSG
jgi:Tfp pilus assembly protein PilX